MPRALLARAIEDHLAAEYTGPVTIRRSEDDREIVLPYAVVRVGTGERLGDDGTREWWMLPVYVAVFHDSGDLDVTTAEDSAAEVFAPLRALRENGISVSEGQLITQPFEEITVEASLVEEKWQHIAAFEIEVGRNLPA